MTKPRLDELRVHLTDYLQICVGSVIIGVGVSMLMVPNKIVAGGVTGVSILLHHTLDTPVGLVLLAINLPIIWLGWRYGGGRHFLSRTVVGVIALSLSIDLLHGLIEPPTTDRLLIIFYGGLLDGLGLALVFRGRGTTGGIDIIGRLAHRWLDLGVGQTMLSINLLVYTMAALVFGLEPAMIALMLAFVSAKVLDTVVTGFTAARSAFIITPKWQELREVILENLGRGVTVLDGYGGLTRKSQPVLYVVVARSEIGRLKRRIQQVDDNAFTAIFPAQEVVGGLVPRRSIEADGGAKPKPQPTKP
jgi:uncharacterized membrane-anchored protein YitT (DUF2179 family)